ncbi:hypothetical protein [Halolamina salifodinae]|uniref:Uncharacterized protein n=1 Tax=Halolamina salifodinae TaxID=1202767 RepID=A0A8T4GUT9_9EURY|nr:hypothetical protein [Halolamina salifodinae]MBP1985892.1 hypothetical protein [Halolamina salifodinae]
MAEYEVIDREVVDQWGEEEGRAEVQAVHETSSDSYEVRMCYYQDNGRFGQSAPTIKPDVGTAQQAADAIAEMAEKARQARRQARLADIEELVDDVGYERAKELLADEASGEGK